LAYFSAINHFSRLKDLKKYNESSKNGTKIPSVVKATAIRPEHPAIFLSPRKKPREKNEKKKKR
jgi:hypothetical protein